MNFNLICDLNQFDKAKGYQNGGEIGPLRCKFSPNPGLTALICGTYQ
jgi:hypothetical protein